MRCGLGCTAIALAVVLAGALPAGAAPPPPGPAPALPQEIPEQPFAGLSERFRIMARRDEQSKDWHRALMRWEAVAAIETRDREARERIAAIRSLLKRNAERHFRLAKAALQADQHAKAFREFLRTLSYDPGNHLALTMVKHELNAKSLETYTVKRGDTLREIAVAEYGDPELTYLVQHFNGIRNPRDLKVGQELRLPVMAGVLPTRAATPQVAAAGPAPAASKPAPKAPERPAPAEAKQPAAEPEAPAQEPAPGQAVAEATTAPEPEPEPAPQAGSGGSSGTAVAAEAPVSAGAAIVAAEVRTAPQQEDGYAADTSRSRLDVARSHLDANRYEEAAATAEAVLEEDPANGDARTIVNAAYYEQGQRLREQEDYLAAMQTLTRVDPTYKDTKSVIASLGGRLEGEQAEVHYIVGVTAYLEEDLDTAIREWELTLKIDPGHAQAAKDLENARALRSKLAQVQ